MNNKPRPSPDFLIVLVILAVFGNALFCWYALDDYRHLVDNVAIRRLGDALGSFSSALYPGNLYRPLVILSYWLVYSFSGLHPFWHHLMNVLLHMGVCLLVYRLSLKIVARKSAFLLALLFAINPLRVEAVTNVSGRAEVLSAFFGLLSVLCFWRLIERSAAKKTTGLYAGALFVTFLCALLSKESAAVFILLIPLYAVFAGKKYLSRAEVISGAAPVVLGLCVYLVFRTTALGGVFGPPGTIDFLDNPLVNASLIERVVNSLALLGKYIFLTLIPLHLSADYSFAAIKPLPVWLSAEGWVWIYLLACVVFLAFRKLSRFDATSFFSLWFLSGFAVTANIFFPIGTAFAERLSYVPGIGLAGLLAIALREVSTVSLRRVLIAVSLVFFGARSVLQNEVWRDNYSLHAYQYGISPQSAKTVMNYGVVLRDLGKLRDSSRLFEKALTIYPAFADASYNLALNEMSLNREAKAQVWLDKTIKLNAYHTPGLNLAGRLALKSGDLSAASDYFERALRVEPHDFKAQIGILAVTVAENNMLEAEAMLKKLKKVSPNHPDLRRMEQLLLKAKEAGK